MSETNERSGASAGSVAGGPLAWCVISDFYHAPVVSADEEAARRLAKGSDKVLALYPNPPLTDAEREAVWAVAEAYAENDDDPECEQIARVMYALWQRTR